MFESSHIVAATVAVATTVATLKLIGPLDHYWYRGTVCLNHRTLLLQQLQWLQQWLHLN